MIETAKSATERALQRIEKSALLSEAVRLEPDLLLVFKTAAAQNDLWNRWGLYNELKYRASALVGWYARRPELRTSGHYIAMIDAIDALLPQEGEQEKREFSSIEEGEVL